MIITPPIRRAPYEFKSLTELKKLIAQRGQFFGEDKSGPACNYRKEYPCDKSLYQYWNLKAHNGLDIPCNDEEPIIASHDGEVVEVSNDESAGLGIVLWDREQKIKTIYWHLKKMFVSVGDKVNQYAIIGLADNTGFSSGTHLHFGLKQTNDNGTTINYDNGYAGAVDPWIYLVWFNNMKLTENMVLALQSLEGYFDPAGAKYWSGKELEDYLKARIKDKIEQLKKYDS